MAVLTAPADAVSDQALNVGRTEENYRIREVAELTARAIPDAEVTFEPGAGPDARHYRVNCDKAQELLVGFKPQWNARRGAEELLAAYRKYGLELNEFEGPRFQRLAHVQMLMSNGTIDSDLRVNRTVPATAEG